ncbi:hypothetical protein RD792_016220 [Penstemon davidsonii]|uniref:Cyclin N-terminal domain-containing protein n=1 Tax=Penstemon davidsonii TaxID=160366 RepID=A0ABR0CIN7_9LAMI|nr:hypothetical protein RD792_016220 [Penstemon davidsonii]
MAVDQNSQKTFFDDVLYCNEEKWVEVLEEEESDVTLNNNNALFPLLLLEQDLFWDDEELKSLFFKEKESTCFKPNNINETIFNAREQAVEWVLKIKAHYGFTPLTAILAVNYLDRFLTTLNFQKEKPWMMQLASVACLSLAAKVEETHVPLLLDLQVEGTEYIFEAKTIQRMELLVLSSLKWRMNPVTPLSFLDHIIRRLGLKSYTHWEFLQSCVNILLSVLSDSRFMLYLPSVLATSTMLHVIHQVESCNAIDYESQLLNVLKINKVEVDECYEFISDTLSKNDFLKRKFFQDSFFNNSDSSNECWEVESCITFSSSSSSHQPFYKKRRVEEQQMKLPSLSRVFVDAVEIPH